MDESLLKKMPFRDILTAFIYLKPGQTTNFVEEALAYGVRSVFKENRDFSWLFHRQNSSGSCGATHNSLDQAIDSLHFSRIAYTPSYQYSRLTAVGRTAVEGMKKEYGFDVMEELKPLAEHVWQRAREYSGMYNRPELYA